MGSLSLCLFHRLSGCSAQRQVSPPALNHPSRLCREASAASHCPASHRPAYRRPLPQRWGYKIEPVVGPLWKSLSGEYSNLRWDVPADQIQYYWQQVGRLSRGVWSWWVLRGVQ